MSPLVPGSRLQFLVQSAPSLCVVGSGACAAHLRSLHAWPWGTGGSQLLCDASVLERDSQYQFDSLPEISSGQQVSVSTRLEGKRLMEKRREQMQA